MNSQVSKIISIICSAVTFFGAGLGLLVGLGSIGATGWNALGVIFIFPSVIALAMIVIDFLITIGHIKGGTGYSMVITIIKLIIIARFIPITIDNYNYQKRFGVSNLDFDFMVIGMLLVATIPSLFNAIRLYSNKKKIQKSNEEQEQ
ncbi:MAG: hypothetical protein IKN74_01560 [Clostridia bacterium]|nr:hypothetical protein [Clostridia bacterium]